MRLWGSREPAALSEETTQLQGVVDIHTHVLPGVDDGAGCIEDTVELLRGAFQAGTRAVVATPHMFLELYYNTDATDIRRRHAEMTAQLQVLSRQPENAFLKDLDVFPGAENYFSTEFVEAAREKRILTLNGSRYLLIEFSAFMTVTNLQMAARHILDLGLIPVIAHPERNLLIQDDPRRVRVLTASGCILQVNGDSILNNSRHIAGTARRLLKEKGPVVIASDGHRPGTRPVQLQAAAQLLAEKYSLQEIKTWMCDRTRAMVEDRPL